MLASPQILWRLWSYLHHECRICRHDADHNDDADHSDADADHNDDSDGDGDADADHNDGGDHQNENKHKLCTWEPKPKMEPKRKGGRGGFPNMNAGSGLKPQPQLSGGTVPIHNFELSLKSSKSEIRANHKQSIIEPSKDEVTPSTMSQVFHHSLCFYCSFRLVCNVNDTGNFLTLTYVIAHNNHKTKTNNPDPRTQGL